MLLIYPTRVFSVDDILEALLCWAPCSFERCRKVLPFSLLMGLDSVEILGKSACADWVVYLMRMATGSMEKQQKQKETVKSFLDENEMKKPFLISSFHCFELQSSIECICNPKTSRYFPGNTPHFIRSIVSARGRMLLDRLFQPPYLTVGIKFMYPGDLRSHFSSSP